MAIVKNVGRTERIVRMSIGIVGILLAYPLSGPARWISLALGVFFFITGLINH